MPIKVDLKKKQVRLTTQTRSILQGYLDTFKQIVPELANRNATNTGNTTALPGPSAKLLNILGSFLNTDLGGNSFDLNADTLTLETPAFKIFKIYTGVLNEMIQSQNLTPQTTEQELLNSPFALARELLLRCVACALSTEEAHHGEKILEGIRAYTNRICEDPTLEEPAFLPSFNRGNISTHPKSSEFQKRLKSEKYNDLMNKISHMVNTIAIIHSNRQLLTNVMSQFRVFDQAIKTHILVYIHFLLGKDQPPECLAENWIDTNFEQIEQEILQGKISKISPEIEGQLTQKHPKLASRQLQILAVLQTKLTDDAQIKFSLEKIASLYESKRNVSQLIDLITHVDLIMLYTGWIFILGGVFDFEKLANLISDYSEQCKFTLAIPTNLAIYKTNISRGLMQIQTGGEITKGMKKISFDLKHLDEEKPIIEGYMRATLFSLLREQNNYAPKYHFLNVECLDSLGFSNKLLESEVYTPKYSGKENPASSPKNLNNTPLYFLLEKHEDRIEAYKKLNLTSINLAVLCTEGPYRGLSALHIAAITGNLIACKWLYENNVQINLPDTNNETASDKALKKLRFCTNRTEENKFTEIIEYLEKLGGNSQKAKQHHTEELHKQLDNWSLILTDYDKKNCITQIKDLIRAGADINSLNPFNKRFYALHTVFMTRDQNLITIFLGGKAKCDVLDFEGQTPYQRLLMQADEKQTTAKFLKTNFPDCVIVATSADAHKAFEEKYKTEISNIPMKIIHYYENHVSKSTPSNTNIELNAKTKTKTNSIQ